MTVVSRRPDMKQGMDVLSHDLAEPLPDVPDLKCASVIHCAAEVRSPDWEQHWRGNVVATRNVLEWAVRHHARRFVLFSTGSVYGFQAGRRMKESDVLAPSGYYGHTKYLVEEICRSYAALFGLRVVMFRLYFPFGPGQTAGMFRFVEDAVRQGNRLQIKRDGAPRVTPIHIDDVVEAVVCSLADAFPEGTYNLCGDEDVSFLELVERMESRIGRPANIERTDDVSGDMMADNSALRRTGWTPRHTIDGYLDQIQLKEKR